MKIFIAGARSVKSLPAPVQQRMMTICQKGFDVLVGDCYGVDTSVQHFYSALGYSKVTVFASNGKARNNIGRWSIRSVPVPPYLHGFDFYKQKDIAMVNEADYGLMIWDGESRGTLNNMINLVSQNKKALVYLVPQDKTVVIRDTESLDQLIEDCPTTTQSMYTKLTVHC